MQNSPESQDFVEKPGGQSRSATQVHMPGAERPQEPPLSPSSREGYQANGRARRGILARHGDAENRRREGLTVPKHPRLLPRFLQSFRCPLVGPAGLARRRRVQLFPGQEFAYGQDLDAGMLAPR